MLTASTTTSNLVRTRARRTMSSHQKRQRNARRSYPLRILGRTMKLDKILAFTRLPEQPPVTADLTLSPTVFVANATYCTDGPEPHWHANVNGIDIIIFHDKNVNVKLTK